MRFKYSTIDPSQNEFDSLPRLPLVLRLNNQGVEVVGLVDSGATVNVLPYEVGLRLGAIWDDRKANIYISPAGKPRESICEVMIMEQVKLDTEEMDVLNSYEGGEWQPIAS